MLLRTKITLAFLLLFAAYLAANYYVERAVTYKHFEELEEQLARRNLDRWIFAVEREITHLAEFAGDWTNWDDAYEFSQDGNQEFVEANLASEEWFSDFNLPVLGFYTNTGEVVWQRWADTATGERFTLPSLEAALFEGGRPLASDDDRPLAKGVLTTEHGLLLVVSRALLRTDGSGPACGFAVFGRFLDDDLTASIAKQTLVSGAVVPLSDVAAHNEGDAPLEEFALAPREPRLQRQKSKLAAYSTIDDVYGEPTILVRSDTPHAITAEGRYSLWFSVVSLGCAGLATVLLQLVFVHWVVVRPIQRLVSHSQRVGATGDLTSRVGRITDDEIGDMAEEFDLMVERLAVSRGDLVAQSRATGQAEIASNVTHNLGNVLNSASVALNSVQRRLDGMRTEGCVKAAELLQDNRDRLPEFLATDAKGKQLPKYLESLAENLHAARAVAIDEARRLGDQLAHMTEILHAQREVARGGAYTETASMHDVIGRALAIVQPSYARHGIAVETDLAELPAVETDPVQVVQVLVNLFTNAKDAMRATPPEDRRLRVGLRRSPNGLAIEVQDTGSGIEPGQIERLFQAGFTTKGSGQGLGLHFCALAAKQLGGSIAVRNAPDGRGAVFTLELPVSPGSRNLAA